MDPERATHWQAEWARARLASATRDPTREKFYALIAYPGTSGFLHLGHLRAFAYLDALHRYHRARGRSVLFPFGVHASGIPAVSWSQRVKDRDPPTVQQLRDAGVPESEWTRLEDPEAAARFLGDGYKRVLRRIGALFDEATYLTTIDDDYGAFVRWQFRALHASGAVVQGTYFASVCPVCGPVAVDASETDLASGGDAEVIRYVLIPFRLEDGRTLLAATLRPETVYGVTNLWVGPEEELVVWHHGSGEYLVARPGGERLVEQHGGHLGRSVPSSTLAGRTVAVPLTDRRVPILTSALVDVHVGTGVVMSVPAHAPADAAAIAELPLESRASLGAPPVLLEIDRSAALAASEEELVTGEGTPAEIALRVVGARNLADRERIDVATERLYRLEHLRGRMTVGPLSGVPVRDARDKVARILAEGGGSFELQEFSKPVICRNGHSVVIRRVPDQWFLHYGDPEWKERTKEVARNVTTWPPEYGHELPGIIDWFADRPCTRKGRWLGTPLPFDPTWIIEPIADSTMYMAYFVVRRFVASGRLATTQLTDAFFDFVFRGRGPGEPTVDPALQAEVRAEFLYWYPLDMNIGGKEHKSVHFPVFLFTHERLLAKELQPRGIYVNGWITGRAGAKISKKGVASAGGTIPPIDDALARWGPDALRYYYVTTAAPSSDVEWSSETVDSAFARLADVERMVRETAGSGAGPPELDQWLESTTHRLIARVREALDTADLRVLAEEVYVGLPSALRRFATRGGVPDAVTDRVGRAWVRLLAPLTPHLAEELGAGRFEGLVAVQPFPSPEEFALSEEAEAREAFLDGVEEDLRAVVRPMRERGETVPTEVVFFVAAPWKAPVEAWMREEAGRGTLPTVRTIMERARQHAELTAYLGEIPKYVQRVAPLLRSESAAGRRSVDEPATLRGAEGYLARRFGFGSVHVVREDEGGPVDPLHRRERSRPGKPAFYLLTRPPPEGS
jgi:leucyl-tRNA synthetase